MSTETLPGLEGFDRRHATDAYPVADRVRGNLVRAAELVNVQAPLAAPLVAEIHEEIARDVKMLEGFYVGAANDLERLWPFLPSGMDAD